MASYFPFAAKKNGVLLLVIWRYIRNQPPLNTSHCRYSVSLYWSIYDWTEKYENGNSGVTNVIFHYIMTILKITWFCWTHESYVRDEVTNTVSNISAHEVIYNRFDCHKNCSRWVQNNYRLRSKGNSTCVVCCSTSPFPLSHLCLMGLVPWPNF